MVADMVEPGSNNHGSYSELCWSSHRSHIWEIILEAQVQLEN